MRNPKYHLYLTLNERRTVINSLIDLRNDLISQGKYTDIIDELLVKLTKAKVKRIKVKEMYLSDLMAWNTAIDYQLDAEVAKMKGNEEEAKIYEDKMHYFMQQNSSQILSDAMDQMDDSMSSPFEVEGMTDKYFEESNNLIAQSQELLEEGKRDNRNGDAYNLVNVIYSVVLFLLGIVGVFKNLPNRVVVLFIAIAGVVLATIYMFTIPLPTGFNILSFFGMA